MFVVGNSGDEFVESFERSLFHQNQHLLLQTNSGWLNFFILNAEKKRCEAYFPIHVDETKASSPLRAPFGSIVFSNQVSPKTLYDFLLYVENELIKIGVKEIYIQNPPLAYQSKNLSLLQTLLLNFGYTVAKAEVSSVVKISAESFYAKINSKQQQRLSNAKAEGLSFEILDVSKIEEIYSLIAQWQNVKGFSLSMTLSDLIKVTQFFPNRFIITVVNQNQTPVAAAISINVMSDITYNFYLSHNSDFNHLSPVLVLLEGIYMYCQKQGVLVLDLGTSSLAGKPNFSLLDFKRRVGAEYTSKFAFSKLLGV